MNVRMEQIFSLLCLLAVCPTAVLAFDKLSTLKSVSVVFRHGDRTPQAYPVGFYPNDPYLNLSFEPMGYGGLTNEGKKREFDIGSRLRERYGEFLGDTYKVGDISVVSTDTERTKQSLLLVLAGLYPPTGKQIWKDDLNWQPVPINSIPFDLQSYMHAIGCPTFSNEYQKYKNSDQYKKDLSSFNKLMRDLTVYTGREIDDIEIVYQLYHTLTAEYNMNLPLPEWTKGYFPNGPIVNATLFEYNSQSKTPLLKKLNGGLLTRKVLDDNIFRKKDNNAKIHMYSCHEDNVAAFLQSLNIWTNSVPVYGSGVVVELHEKDSEYFIKTLYYKGIPAEFEVRIVPGCTEYCPLDDFLHILKDQIPEGDIMETCFGPPENSQLIPKDTNAISWIYDKIRLWFNL